MVNSQGLPFELRGAVASTRVWAPEHEVEPAALDQLRNISRLPWVHGVRAMPDVHLGKGATVGSVIAMRDAGKAVLLVSLELDEVMSLSDRILVMYEGEIVGEFDPKTTTVQELGLYMAGARKQGKESK